MSHRASIFVRILPYIDSNDWGEYGDFIVFGREAFEAPGSAAQGNEEEQTSEALDGFAERVKRHRGSSSASERTGLDAAQPLDVNGLIKDLPPAAREALAKAIEKLGEEKAAFLGTRTQSDAANLDALDKHYAEEVISKLSRVVRLVSAFDPVEVSRSPAPNVRDYFTEVHNCFLYDFRVACAVLCRALLETALQERLYPKKQSKPKNRSKDLTPKERKKSTILKLLDLAKELGILDGSRVEAGENTKDAGDAAIHRLDDFKGLCDSDDKLFGILDGTRKVLEDLYRATPGT